MDCCDNVGGRVVVTIGNQRYSSRGGITVRPTNFERSVVANDDGTIAIQTKPVPFEAEFSLSDECGLDPNVLMSGCRFDVTLEWIDARKKYLFTRATLIGRPEISSESGEMRGIRVVSANAQMIRV